MPSTMVPETCTFDGWLGTVGEAARGLELARALDVVAQLAGKEFDARLRFVKILGRRWSYVAGYRLQTPAAPLIDRISLGGGVGLVADSWGTLSGSARARLLAFLGKMVSPREQP